MKKNIQHDSEAKRDFLHELSSMSRDEIDKFIQENGKGPKLIKPVIFYEKPDKNS